MEMDAQTETSLVQPALAPLKFSRYRAVRNAATRAALEASTSNGDAAYGHAGNLMQPHESEGEEAIKKSMSRYRRERKKTNASLPSLPVSTSTALMHSVHGTSLNLSKVPFPETHRNYSNPRTVMSSSNSRITPVPNRSISADSAPKPFLGLSSKGVKFNRAQQEAFDILTGEAERQKIMRQRQKSDSERLKNSKVEPDYEKHPGHQVILDKELQQIVQMERPLEEIRTGVDQFVITSTEDYSPIQIRSKPLLPISPDEELAAHTTALEARNKHKLGKIISKDLISSPTAVNPKVVDVADSEPAFDAPVSAVNAGQRRVLVKCNKSSILLPVTPSTTPVDIILSAANVLNEKVDIKIDVILESFRDLGLERSLRRYEHIRDVMNSWDHDDQNCLLITAPQMDGHDVELDVIDAPSEQPGNTSVSMYHSQKPNSWAKRWITLRADGQVLLSKQPLDDKNPDNESKNICHMSDFDVYIPIARQIKRLKPPKKICFAIKSQQKSAMFLSTENYVHFFATKDAEVAKVWYEAVQKWRSWYLVYALGLGSTNKLDGGVERGSENRLSSLLPYQIGSFKPLMPKDSLDLNPELTENQGSLFVHKSEEPITHLRRTSAPSVSNRRPHTSSGEAQSRKIRKSSIIQEPSRKSSEMEPFAPSGLLGRTYTQRKASMSQPSSATNYAGEPPVPKIPLGLNQKPKPLIDLASQEEDSHHLRLGQENLSSLASLTGGLISIATNRESTRPTCAPGKETLIRSVTQKSSRTRQRAATTSNAGNSNNGPLIDLIADGTPFDLPLPGTEAVGQAFTGGLLANTVSGQGERSRGRGVKTGDRDATEPMVELGFEKPWVKGSLLDAVEQRFGSGPAVVLDRENKVEQVVKTGEVR